MSVKGATWPLVPGTYKVGDPNGPVAVCALTSEKLMGPLAATPGVAIAGMVYTANLGIIRIVINITSNPAIRFLLICGRDSALFKPGQSLVSLSEKGIDEKKRIIDAAGYDPVLPSIDPDQIKQFRKQVEVIDWAGEEDLQVLLDRVKNLADRNPGVFETGQQSISKKQEQFETIRPGGQREPLIYDPKGYFVISIEPDAGEIVLRHYLPDHTPAHEMHGRGATSMLLGLLRDGLVTQLSHAGYLGEELAKAQTALQFGLRYDQDRPLKAKETVPPPPPVQPSEPPKITPVSAHSLKKFGEIVPGTLVDFFFTVTDTPRDHTLGGFFIDMDESGAARIYTRTSQRVEVAWTGSTKLIMGNAGEIVVGAILRVTGNLDEKKQVFATQLVILTKVAKITE